MKDHDGDVLSIGSRRPPSPSDGPPASGLERASGDRDVPQLLEQLRRLNADLERQNRELRRDQLKLAASRDRWSVLWAHAPVGCVVLDADGRILDANLAATVMLGAARPRLLGRRLAEWLDERDADALYRLRRAAAMHLSAARCGVGLVYPDGSVVPTSLRLVAVRGEQGRTEWMTALVDETSFDHA